MRHHGALWRTLVLWITLGAALTVFLEGLRLVAGAPFSWGGLLARWAFIAILLLAARWTQPRSVGGTLYVWPWSGVMVAGVGAGAILTYVVSGSTWAAWIVPSALYLLLLGLGTVLASGRSAIWRWGVWALLALAGGAIPVSIAQIESHFADEEFFVALQALALSLFWVLCCWRRGACLPGESQRRHGEDFVLTAAGSLRCSSCSPSPGYA